MWGYIARRLLAMVPLIVIVVALLFLILELVDSDAADTIAGPSASQEQVDAVREELGLDEPALTRFWDSLVNVAHGDFGTSYISGENVLDAILRRVPITLSLGAVALTFAVVVGVGVGIAAALRPGGWVDRGVSAFAALSLAVPPFVLGLLLVILFALTLGWLPATGYVRFSEDPGEWLRSVILPGIALGTIPMGELARHTRASMIDTLDADYIRTARSKGLRGRPVVLKHAAKNAAAPVLTMLGVIVGAILGSSITIEFIFGIPGMGALAFDSVSNRDIPMIQGIVLLSAIVVLLVNLLVDIAYAYLNPRLRT